MKVRTTLQRLMLLSALMVLTGICRAQSSITVTWSGGRACNEASTMDLTMIVRATAGGIAPTLTASALAFGDIMLTKYVDDCSPALYEFTSRGAYLPQVVISLHQPVNGLNLEIQRITLTQVLISSIVRVDTGKDPGGRFFPAERVTFSYQKIEILDVITGAITGYETLWRKQQGK